MTTCFFCNERMAISKSKLMFEMYQQDPPYRSTTVNVPRCEECESIQSKMQRFARRFAIAFILVSTVMCILPPLLISITAWNPSFHWGVASAVGVFTCVLILVVVPSLWERRMLRSVGAKYSGDVRNKYPEVIELKEEGWKLTVSRHAAAWKERKRVEASMGDQSCAVCGSVWGRRLSGTVSNQAFVFGGAQADSSQYAGRCPNCRAAYCARCASTRGIGFLCPDCDVELLAKISN